VRRLRRHVRLVHRHHGHLRPLSLPEMQKYGYDTRLSVGCIASAGTFASMIPPA